MNPLSALILLLFSINTGHKFPQKSPLFLLIVEYGKSKKNVLQIPKVLHVLQKEILVRMVGGIFMFCNTGRLEKPGTTCENTHIKHTGIGMC